MNLLQFETSVANELGLDPVNEKTIIDDSVNVAVQRVLEDTHCFVTSENINVSSLSTRGAIAGDYDLPPEILEVVEIYTTSGGTIYTLERLGEVALIQKRRVSNPSGTPSMFYATSGANMLMMWPTPASTDVLTVYYVPLPTALSGPTDDPSTTTIAGVPQILHEAVFLFACSRGASYDDDQSSAQGQRYRDWYDKEIIRYKTIIRKRGGERNARAIVNDKRRRGRFHDNSIWPAN
jgi:hypothetical protein